MVCGLILWVVGMRVGTELFPQVDSGEFVLRFRPPPGSNFDLTRQMAVKCLEEIESEAKTKNIKITMGFVGQVAPNFGIDNMVLFMRGPDDGQLRVALRDDSGIKLDAFRERLRKVLPERVIPWMAKRLEQGGLSHEEAEQQAKLSTFGFEPGDIVTRVMSFGSPTPIAVRLIGTDLDDVRDACREDRRQDEAHPLPPRCAVRADARLPLHRGRYRPREGGPQRRHGPGRAQGAHHGDGVDPFHRPQLLDRWQHRLRLPGPGADTADRMVKAEDIGSLPIATVNPLVNLMVRDVATVRRGVRPGEYDRDMSQRYLTLTANVEGEDMGRASRQVARAIAAAGKPPEGVRVELIGQVPPMNEMFKTLGIGLAVAVFVILLLLTAFFQSPSLGLISIGAVPGVLAGIAIILYFTNTSLNIESFMGSIMSLGVSVSNSVLLVAFMNDHWKAGKPSTEAAIAGARDRLRAILMTACAMTIGMVPMALALERGSGMQAPLGRAVIGGLVMSTVATLLVVPSIFAVVIGRKAAHSPSICPDDPASSHFDPEAFPSEEKSDEKGPSPTGPACPVSTAT